MFEMHIDCTKERTYHVHLYSPQYCDWIETSHETVGQTENLRGEIVIREKL